MQSSFISNKTKTKPITFRMSVLGWLLVTIILQCGGEKNGLESRDGIDGSRSIVIHTGTLDAPNEAWIQSGAAWSRAVSAATQMVVAVNGLVLLNVEAYGQSVREQRLDTARKSLEILTNAGRDLSTAVETLESSLLIVSEVSAPNSALALAVRTREVIGRFRTLADACVSEASRVGALLEPLDSISMTNESLERLATELASNPRLAVAVGPVIASAGTVTRAVLPKTANLALQAQDATLAMSLVGAVPVVSGTAEPDGDAGWVPLSKDSVEILLWRNDAMLSQDKDRAVAGTGNLSSFPEDSLLTILFEGQTTASLLVRPLARGEACWSLNLATEQACTIASSGLLPEGRYRDNESPSGEVESQGLSPSVARRIASGLAEFERVIELEEDNEVPPPRVYSMNPTEGPVGTSITITGSGFGNDPAAVKVEFMCGQWSLVSPVAISDTSLTVVFPYAPAYSVYGPFWCTYRPERFQYCGVYVEVRGKRTFADYFTLVDLPFCPVSVDFGPRPDTLSIGDTFYVQGKGFSNDPEKNIALFAGNVTAKAVKVEKDLDKPEYARVYFEVPEGAVSGGVVFRSLDGVDIWSEPVSLNIVAPTVPELLPGSSAEGLHIPCAVRDPGRPTEWVQCHPHAWVFQHRKVDQLHWDCPGARDNNGPLSPVLVVETRLGSVELQIIPLKEQRLLVLDPSVPPLIYLQVGDTVTMRIRGREKGNLSVRTSEPISLPVVSRAETGTFKWISKELWEGPGDVEPIQVAFGDPIVFYDLRCDTRLVGPGLWDGEFRAELDWAFTPAPCWEHQFDNCLRGFRVVPKMPGTYIVTNQEGVSRVIEVSREGAVHQASLEVYDHRTRDYVPVPHLAEDGGILGCGGVRLEIPPGALPLHEGKGSYRVTCVRTKLESLALPELTTGGLQTRIEFEPEPQALLKPIAVTIPFDPEKRGTDPDLGLFDPQSGLYATLPSELVDEDHIRLVLPRGQYGATTPSGASLLALPISSFPLSNLSLNTLLSSLVAAAYKTQPGILRDEVRQLQVNYVATPGQPSYVPDQYAGDVLSSAQIAWDFMVNRGWPRPDGWLGGWIVLTITNMGPASAIKGSATKGVFGQPWVLINSNLTMGPMLETTTAHEMGHVFQRQLTNVFTFKWIDEAAAQWTAVGALGSAADISQDILGGSDFPTVTIPSTFGSGYDEDQAYAAGVLAVWLESVSPGSILRIYEQLRDSYLSYLDAWGTISAATAKSINSIAADFGVAYWSQQLDLVKNIYLNSPLLSWRDWSGVTIQDRRPPLSSKRWDIDVRPIRNELAGRDLVVRASGLDTGHAIYVYSDQMSCAVSSPNMEEQKILLADSPAALLGTHQSNILCYRIIVLNYTTSNTTDISVVLTAPHIESLSPTQGSNRGGYPITISGYGFGNVQGRVLMFGVDLTVTQWGNRSITATMFNAGTMTGPVDLYIITAEGAKSNEVSFTLTN